MQKPAQFARPDETVEMEQIFMLSAVEAWLKNKGSESSTPLRLKLETLTATIPVNRNFPSGGNLIRKDNPEESRPLTFGFCHWSFIFTSYSQKCMPKASAVCSID